MLADDVTDLPGHLSHIKRIVVREVGDSHATAEVELHELDSQLVAKPCSQCHHALRGSLESAGVEDLRADV